jgi:hypothetical protein
LAALGFDYWFANPLVYQPFLYDFRLTEFMEDNLKYAILKLANHLKPKYVCNIKIIAMPELPDLQAFSRIRSIKN